ncbi:hypothetical protein [Sphingobacterium haloxyli]|uniref:DUF308 domain-containing protein n=1 Tax=Sphingobacterium haloxyli TaxID=2100533 RepID=A0A2S9IY48_9SPHI|nr:hypothetical protein [Sphingobacterium haloxyli]PRD45447.1 hypothetical protein C5745_18335 [Sphingobacterium haloxyli]
MDQQDLIKEIGHIRSMMEKSSKVLSISGLSGVLIGIYALLGAAAGYVVVYGFDSRFNYRDHYVTEPAVINNLMGIALTVLIASLTTGLWMARKKAKKNRQHIWNPSSKAMLLAMAIPLIAGGLFSLVLLSKGYFSLIGATLLIFYGLSLTSGGIYTFKEVRWLGVLEILLGLFALLFPGYGLWFWAVGFGVLHIIYGFIVHKRYE